MVGVSYGIRPLADETGPQIDGVEIPAGKDLGSRLSKRSLAQPGLRGCASGLRALEEAGEEHLHLFVGQHSRPETTLRSHNLWRFEQLHQRLLRYHDRRKESVGQLSFYW